MRSSAGLPNTRSPNVFKYKKPSRMDKNNNKWKTMDDRIGRNNTILSCNTLLDEERSNS